MKLTLTEKSVLKLIKEDEAYSNYFFGRYDKVKLFSTLEDKGFFAPEKNPRPKKVKDGYQILEWNILPYLEKISKKSRSRDTDLLKIIRNASLHKDKDGKYIDNDRTRWYFVKILSNIPLSVTPLSIFNDVIPTWLESDFSLILPGAELTDELLYAYLKQAETPEGVEKVEKLINIVLSTKEVKLKSDAFGKTEELKTKIEDYWLEEAFIKKGYSTLIAQKCTNLPIFSLADTIRTALSKRYKKQDYSSIWLNDLSIDEERTSHYAEYFLTQILRILVLEKAKFDSDTGSEIVKRFLDDEYPHYLFKRLGILLIAKNWKAYGELFDLILGDKKEGYFDHEAFQPELFYLLSSNAHNLTKNQKTKLKAIIEKGPTKKLPDEKKEAYSVYWKQVLCKTLFSLPEFELLYKRLKRVSKKDVNIPSHSGVVAFRDDSFDKSPVSPEGFLEKTNKEIVDYLHTYKPTGDFYHHSPEGVYRAFQSAVEINPEKFASNLDPFNFHDYHMLSSLFNGFEGSWKQKKDINWENVTDFTLKLIKESWFWKPTDKDKGTHYDYFSWTISAIGDLLQEGCKTDDWAFSENNNERVEKILNILISKLEFDDKSYQGDGMSHALNSSWGKVLTALIYLGLRQARISDKKQEKKNSKWSDSLKNDFQTALDKNIFEAFTLLGHYFPNLHYVDKEWTKSKATEIIRNIDDRYFETFMEGYLYNSSVYKPIFSVLKKHYERSLQIPFKDSQIKNRLIQHIGIWYLRGVEKINKNSLVDKIFALGNFEQIRELVEFLWHERDHITDKSVTDENVKKEQSVFKERILTFWKHTSEVIKTKATYSEDEKKVLSELSKLAIYLDCIDENSYMLLMQSAGYVNENFDSPYFIKYLNKLKNSGKRDRVSKYIGTLFLEMLNKAEGRIPDYKWKNVVEIVEHLYEVGKSNKEVKDLANSICDFYGRHQNYGLRTIYDKNNAIPKQ